MSNLSRQEIAYTLLTSTFRELLNRDERIGTEVKSGVVAYWEDMFAHPGVKNNMLQAISNVLAEEDKRVDAARIEGIMSVKDAVAVQLNPEVKSDHKVALFQKICDDLVAAENMKEEMIDAETMDLSELGEDDEDDTPLI